MPAGGGRSAAARASTSALRGTAYTARVNDLAPGLLVALPQLTDPHFDRAVVLLVHQDEDGAMGFVVNHRSTTNLAELAAAEKSLHVAPERLDDVLYVGGPVERYRGFLLHDCATVEERKEILPGLYLSVSTESLESLLRDPKVRVRLIMGYSGWGKGQLEREIAEGSWFFAEASPEQVLSADSRGLWTSVLDGLGIAPGWSAPSQGVH